MTYLRLGSALGCALLLAACATVTRGTTNQVKFMSEPSGASVKTSSNLSCTTPCTLSVGRKDEFSATISLPGYKSETVEIKTRLAGEGAAGFVGNVIIGGGVGMVADVVTGATLEHFPNPVEVKLTRLAAAPKRR